ncbi:MAG: hypothetical protein JNK87_11485 [Bryobacterales bacterium]|nr:hypothetical protein [Bryobacterales bacterium]
MPQLGILFDAQKLGSGFYGYTAFRILFTAIPQQDLAGCNLYHGEIGEGRLRPYCIAIESEHPGQLPRIRQVMANSMARGLLPINQRFLDGSDLQDEVLALAARITNEGDIADTQSRWLQEAWQRAQGQVSLHASGEPRPATQHARPPQESRPQPKLPEKVPMALTVTPLGLNSLAYLLAFCVGGALAPWFGWGVALCALVLTAGLVQAAALHWRLHAEIELSDDQVLGEAKKLLGSKPLLEVAEKLGHATALKSPLLRRLHATARANDLPGACLIAEQHDRADRDSLEANALDLRTQGWMIAAAAFCALGASQMISGGAVNVAENQRLAYVGVAGCAVLQVLSNLLQIRGQRLQAAIRDRIGEQWLPLLSKAMPTPKAQTETLEKALHELANEFQALRLALERRRDSEFVDMMGGLRSSIDQLTPVLASFREPFILQAVPVAGQPPVAVNGRPKAMSATA